MMNSSHPTIVEVDLGAIYRNVVRIKLHCPNSEIQAVIKADAYGHGMAQVAKTVMKAGATRLAVAHLSEGIELRKMGITDPIHVLGGFFKEQVAELRQYNLELTIGSIEQWHALLSVCKDIELPAVHIKFDTGMGRVGFPWDEADFVFKELTKRQTHFKGLMTHFATSDERDKTFAHLQLDRFVRVQKLAKQFDLTFDYMHAANSGAILDLPESHFNLVRPGVILYGNYPSNETSESIILEPAISWRSKIVQVKKVHKGESVSYGATWRPLRDTRVAVVPVGYADGYRRKMSGQIVGLIKGRRVAQVGRICMDLTMFELPQDMHIMPGEEIVLLGRQGDDEIKVSEFCSVLETIPYEITCMIGKRVPRVYFSGEF